MVTQSDWLRGTRVRRTRHHGAGVLAGPRDQRPDQHRGQSRDAPAGRAHPEPDVRRNQVVARPTGVKLGPEISQPVGYAAFDG